MSGERGAVVGGEGVSRRCWTELTGLEGGHGGMEELGE